MAKHRAAASGGIQMLHKENRNDFRMVQLFKSHSESHLWQQTAATSTDQWSIEQKKDRKPYLYRFAICHLRCVLRKVEASRVLAFLHERWARLPDEPQCLQTKQQEHSQLCQQLGRALLAAFLKFSFLLPLSKNFQKLSWSRHPCSHLPIPYMLHISEIPSCPFSRGERKVQQRTHDHGKGKRSTGHVSK